MDLAQRMRQARLDAGLSQRQAARDTGIRQSLISRYESGVIGHPSDVHLRLLAERYGAPLIEWQAALWQSLVPSGLEVSKREGEAAGEGAVVDRIGGAMPRVRRGV